MWSKKCIDSMAKISTNRLNDIDFGRCGCLWCALLRFAVLVGRVIMAGELRTDFFFWLRIAQQSPQSCLVPYLRNKFKVIIIKSRAKCKRTIIVENKWMTICLAAPQITNPLNVLTTFQIKLLANRQFNLFCFYCNSILSSGAVYGLSSGSYARNELFFCSRLSASVILCILLAAVADLGQNTYLYKSYRFKFNLHLMSLLSGQLISRIGILMIAFRHLTFESSI